MSQKPLPSPLGCIIPPQSALMQTHIHPFKPLVTTMCLYAFFYYFPCLLSIVFIPWYQSVRTFRSQQCSSALLNHLLDWPLVTVRSAISKDLLTYYLSKRKDQWYKVSSCRKILIIICLSELQSVAPNQNSKMWPWSLVTVLPVSIQPKATFQKLWFF